MILRVSTKLFITFLQSNRFIEAFHPAVQEWQLSLLIIHHNGVIAAPLFVSALCSDRIMGYEVPVLAPDRESPKCLIVAGFLTRSVLERFWMLPGPALFPTDLAFEKPAVYFRHRFTGA